MKLKPEVIEKIEQNKTLIHSYGLNRQNQFSVLTKDPRKTQDYCKKELPEVVNIYSVEYCDTCDICKGIFYHEDLKKDELDNKCCTLCS